MPRRRRRLERLFSHILSGAYRAREILGERPLSPPARLIISQTNMRQHSSMHCRSHVLVALFPKARPAGAAAEPGRGPALRSGPGALPARPRPLNAGGVILHGPHAVDGHREEEQEHARLHAAALGPGADGLGAAAAGLDRPAPLVRGGGATPSKGSRAWGVYGSALLHLRTCSVGTPASSRRPNSDSLSPPRAIAAASPEFAPT